MGYGVIGSPTGSGPVSLGSSPGTPAFFVARMAYCGLRATFAFRLISYVSGDPGRLSVLIQACLNGSTTRAEHPAVPLTPAELAAEARASAAAGAGSVHLHPRDP